ncbi:MAG: radical SAM protein [Thermodesulfobacteriota bacterium]|nr:radical SAM protein [Thermodesulfobacteriota bacterium]
MKDLFLNQFTRRNYLINTAKLCFKLGLFSIFFDCFRTEASSDITRTTIKRSDSSGSGFEPAYLKLHKTGELKKRAGKLWTIMGKCTLCPRRCGVNRLKGNRGFCNAPGATLVVSAVHPHFGEERPLVGNGGSGTIFLTHCNLRCVFCQNWEISQLGRGDESNIDELTKMMLHLQKIGCHNINFVTPTHYSAHILKALDKAAEKGLRLPIVYNTSGWERVEILKLLDGIVDIYLPDFKYWDGDLSAKYSSGAESYPEMTREAILEMYRQVGVAKPAKDGIMQRGLIIRHLVMPNNTSGSEEIMEWIAKNLPKDTYVNVMAQYNPVYKAYDYPELSRRINSEEYKKVVKRAKEMGLTNLDIQGYWWLQR